MRLASTILSSLGYIMMLRVAVLSQSITYSDMPSTEPGYRWSLLAIVWSIFSPESVFLKKVTVYFVR